MRTAIDDFPSLSSSRMRAAGHFRSNDTTAMVAFPSPHDDAAFVVALSHFRWPNGGVWSFFRCPCGRRARILRLFDNNELVCRGCLKARGFRARVELIATPVRAAHTVPRRLGRLASATPARLYPRPGRVLDRRSHLEASLRRSQIVARQHALDEHADQLAGLMRSRDK
jgi:hypothetical protein